MFTFLHSFKGALGGLAHIRFPVEIGYDSHIRSSEDVSILGALKASDWLLLTKPSWSWYLLWIFIEEDIIQSRRGMKCSIKMQHHGNYSITGPNEKVWEMHAATMQSICRQSMVSLKSSFRGLRKSWINLLTIPRQQASRQGQFAVESKEQHYSVIFYLSVVAYSPHAEIYANRNFVQTGPLLHGLLTLKRFANFISTINCFRRRSSEKSERQGP